MRLDDSILDIFELNDRLDALRTRNEALYLSLLQFEDPPSMEFMAEAGRTLRAELVELEPIAAGVADELRGGGGPRRGRRPDSRRGGLAGSLRYPRPAEDALEAAGHRPRPTLARDRG